MSELERARSFERIAADYERHRPGYPREAVEWLAERLRIARGTRVLDLGAGTGKFTRSLVELGADVVAVEPGAPMLEQLRAALPQVETHVGAAESIPLPDASVDAVTAAQSFHWFRPGEALPEIRRVLRAGGGLGMIWNWWDETDPLQARLVELITAVAAPEQSDDPTESGLFRDLEMREFTWGFETSPDALVARLSTTSQVVTATPERRETILGEARALAERRGDAFTLAQKTYAHVCHRRD